MSNGMSDRNLTSNMEKFRLVYMFLSELSPQDLEKEDINARLEELYNITLSPKELSSIEKRYMPDLLGPKHESLTTGVIITLIYVTILITGVVGNFCTCLVIIRNKYMRTVTNYYLFNLSVSDLLLLLLGLPQEINHTWSAYPFPLGETFCRFRYWASEVSSNVSILTITAFTVERYIAICHPIKFPTYPGLSRPLRVMAAVWIISTICAIPIALQFEIHYVRWQRKIIPESARCSMLTSDVAMTVFQVSTFLFFIIPMTLIALLYFFIALAIRRSTLSRAGSDSSNDGSRSHSTCEIRQNTSGQQHARIRQSVLKMLVAVVVAFFLCWAPYHTERLLVVYAPEWTETSRSIHHALFYVSGVMYYLSATINPVLYSIMSLKFRQAFRATLLCCWWSRSGPKRRANRNSYTFKFQHRAHLNTHCSFMESSSSTNNNSTNNNKQANSNHSTPILCCAVGTGAVTTQLEGCPLVEMFACEGVRGHSYESNGIIQPNGTERML
ncbi:pyrokinin-1 receptor-like [Physella acuta]|uniref:pyrokinin-1 receptor-like n=1 Tax=Physella acuta TaxID=109671 RepID=UPI0027DC9474|nr:pyrokinin-1 receptor-like [Physella acuta]